jgi:hypothetical protein
MKRHLDEAKSSVPWNEGRLVGQKAPLRLKEIWAIRIRLQLADNTRDLALFNLAIDSGSKRAGITNSVIYPHIPSAHKEA